MNARVLAGALFLTVVTSLLSGCGSISTPSTPSDKTRPGPLVMLSGSMTLQDCINAAGAGGTCSVPTNQTPSATVTISLANQTLICSSGVTITRGAHAPIVTVTGAGDMIQGCTFDGNLAVYNDNSRNGDVVAADSASDFAFYSNTVTNGGRVGIFLDSVNGATVANNTFIGNQSDGIYGLENATNISVVKNTITTPLSGTWRHAIGFHSQTPGTAITNITINDNIINNGESFCVEVGAFGGNAPTGITVSNNQCTELSGVTGGFGGYSFDTVVGPVVSDNSYINTTTAMPSLPGLELVNGTGATANGNQLTNATVSVNKETYSTVSNNTISITQAFSAKTGIFYIGSSSNVNNNGVNVSGNSITATLASSPFSLYVFWIQCNYAGISCNNITIANNNVTSTHVLPFHAIYAENDTGSSGSTIDDLSIDNNSITNWQYCYQISSTGTSYSYNYNTGNCM